jgi:hypothetical protein
MNGSSASTVEAVTVLGMGSKIELTYGTDDRYTDVFELKTKYYSGLGATVKSWVNTTRDGWQNDFAPNKASVESGLFKKKVKILVKK